MELELHVGSIAKKAGVGVQTLHYIMSALISSQSLHDQKRTTVFILPMLCELMAIPGVFFGKHTELACLIFSPLDRLERKWRSKRRV